MGPRWVLARREWNGLWSERTILLAVVVQVALAGFSSFLAAGLAALTDPSALPIEGEPIVAINARGTPDELEAALRDAGLELYRARNDNEAWEAFLRGDAHAALLVVPAQAEDQAATVTLGLPDGDIRAAITVVKVRDGLEAWERGLREDRAGRLAFEPVYFDSNQPAGSYGFVYALLIPLLVFVPVVLAGALCADAVTEEVHRGTLPLLLVSPARAIDILEGKALAYLAVAPLLGAAWLALLGLNDLPVPLPGAVAILVLATSAAALMCVMGSAIALVTRDRNQAHTAYAGAFMVLLGASLFLPASPVNVVARLAAGSAGPEAWSAVAATAGAALLAWLILRFAAPRAVARLAAGDASPEDRNLLGRAAPARDHG